MSDLERWRRLRALLDQGSLPHPAADVERAQEDLYSRYLAEHGLTEADVLPQVDWQRVSLTKKRELLGLLGWALGQGLNSPDDILKPALLLLSEFTDKPSANRLIRWLLYRLRSDLHELGISTPDVVAGVFPVSSFNGHSVIREGTPLVFANNGALVMLECAGMILAAEKLRPSNEQVELLLRLAKQYCNNSMALTTEDADHPLIWKRAWTPLLITAAEEFLLAHELGHIVLGHTERASQFSLPLTSGQSTTVLSHDQESELLADGWAIIRMVERCQVLKKSNSLALDMAAAGPLIFLGTALLVEEVFRTEGVRLAKSHPPAALRLYAAECLLEVLNLDAEMNAGRHYLQHIKECLKSLASDRYPPLLSRDLNRVVCPIVEELGIDNERMEMLREFR